MTEVVTSASLLDEIRMARDGMVAASAWAKSVGVDKPRAEVAHETAYAHAFIRAKEDGATDSLAKAKATIETTVERQKFLELKEESMVARGEQHAWASLFEAYRSISFVVREEMRLGDSFG